MQKLIGLVGMVGIIGIVTSCGGDKDKSPETTPAKAPAAVILETAAAPGTTPTSSPPPAATDPTAQAKLAKLARVAKAARCTDPASVLRIWCIPATGWAKGAAADIPAGAHVYVGLTVEVQDGKSVAEALRDNVSLSALGLKTDGKKVSGKIVRVTPSNDDERKMMAEAVMNLSMVFKGSAASAPLDKGLHSYLSTLPAQADHPVTRAGSGWTLVGASTAELRKAGDYWVAVEFPPSGPSGAFISVFTDKIEAKK